MTVSVDPSQVPLAHVVRTIVGAETFDVYSTMTAPAAQLKSTTSTNNVVVVVVHPATAVNPAVSVVGRQTGGTSNARSNSHEGDGHGNGRGGSGQHRRRSTSLQAAKTFASQYAEGVCPRLLPCSLICCSNFIISDGHQLCAP